MRAAAICLFLAGVAVADERKPNHLHAAPDEGFRVGLPGKPTHESYDLTTLAGPLTVHTTKYDTGRDLRLTITSTTYPPTYAKVPPDKLFAGMMKEMLGADGCLEREEKVTLGPDKHPGRDWRITAGKTVIRVRVFLVGTRLYQVMANGSKDAVGGPAAEDLFNTFELAK